MKVPQLELGPRLGGLKILYQRTTAVAGLVTMVSSMVAAYSTAPMLRQFFGSFIFFVSTVFFILLVYMLFDYMVILPSEQRFLGTQAQRTERSPLKRDTEKILELLTDE